jgi:Tol biopolymer transport system component
MMVIVSAGSLIQLQPASATFPGKNGKIVFQRNIGAAEPQIEIFTVNPDGSGLTQLTSTGVGVSNTEPRWSADGTEIVFRRSPGGSIWTMKSDGSVQTQITYPPAGSGNYHPAFSPDGSKIVFENVTSSVGSIWVTNLDGTNQKALTTGPSSDYYPVWSPDGLKIAFDRSVPSGYHIFVMNAADGSGQTDISKDPNAQDYDPEWSPDGRMIAFDSSPSHAIWVMNADGSGRKQLSNPTGLLQDSYPAWSPDGAKIAFARTAGAPSIIVMNAADGSNSVDITHLQAHSDTDEDPNWQPLRMGAVGGLVMPTNKLEISTPYLELAGLVAIVSAVVVVKRRRD